MKGVSPVVASVLLIAIAVIGSVTVWFWTSSYTVKPALAETVQKAITITQVYKNSSGDGCYSLDIKNSGGSVINNAVFEIRNLQTGAEAGMGGMWLQDPGLVSYWNFDEAAGNWTRDSKTGNNGTYYNEAVYNGDLISDPTRVSGKYGNGLDFDGWDCVHVGNDSVFNTIWGTENFTLMAWIYPLDWVNYRGIINKRKNDYYSATPAGLFTDVGGIKFIIGTGNPAESTDGLVYQPNLNEWHHVAGTANGTHMILYVDGVIRANKSILLNPPANNDSVTIGCFYNQSPTSGYRVFNGTIDSVRIWNRALNQSEIQTEMNSARPVIRPVAAWEFDEGTGTIANDTHIWTAGKYGSGIDFDGVNDYVQVPHSNSLEGMGALTINFWVNPVNNTNLYLRVMEKTRSYWIYFDRFDWDTARFYNRVYSTSGTSVTESCFAPYFNWSMVTIVYDGLKVKNFVDGIQVVIFDLSLTGAVNSSGNNLYIGAMSTSAYFMQGKLDDISIFNRSLSAAEIASIYGGGLALGDSSKLSYLNVSIDLSPGATKNYNFSYSGNASARISLPRGSYILRASSPGYVDQRFTCA